MRYSEGKKWLEIPDVSGGGLFPSIYPSSFCYFIPSLSFLTSVTEVIITYIY